MPEKNPDRYDRETKITVQGSGKKDARTENTPPGGSRLHGAKQGRMANLELLRCVAMMMVVVLHYLGKGQILGELPTGRAGAMETAAWLLESFCIVAVDTYMFISGYFLCTSSFKLSRLLQLWLQIWVYSVAFGLLGSLTGVMREADFGRHFLLTLLLPVTMGHYWFMTAYVFLYLLLPFVGIAAKKMTKTQMKTAVGLLLFTFSILKSILPVRLEEVGLGYDCLWYLCVFLTAAYVRRFGLPFLEKKGRGLLLYVGSCLLIFGGTMALRAFYLRSGSLESIIGIFMEYNHILPLLASIGLFTAFSRMRIEGRAAGIVCRVAPCTLGVYLLHENMGFRYTWQRWLGSESLAAVTAGSAPDGAGAVCGLFLRTGLAVACVFGCGILVDMVRRKVFGALHRGLLKITVYNRLMNVIEKTDASFRETEGTER